MRAGGVRRWLRRYTVVQLVALGRVKAASRPGRISAANALQLQMCRNFFRLRSKKFRGLRRTKLKCWRS